LQILRQIKLHNVAALKMQTEFLDIFIHEQELQCHGS